MLKNLLKLFCISLMLISCQSKTDYLELISNENHLISYQLTDSNLLLKLDMIGDETNNLDGQWPKMDFYTIWVDYNHNGQADSLIDRSFSPHTAGAAYTVCKSLMLDGGHVMTPCKFYFGASCSKSFKATKSNEEPHVVFEMTIPRSELSMSGESIVLVIDIIDGDGQRYTYPNFTYTNPFEGVLQIDSSKEG
ncbi:hypothetical protein [Marinoscillum sp.]|uniref:hypothetical protein n=1 Tax=Marinoscillum sp. TaxID=2024838 RepID=UPI003BA87BDE